MPKRCNPTLKAAVVDTYRAVKPRIRQKGFCALIRLAPRRLQRWRKRGTRLTDLRAGYAPGTAPHRLLSIEKETILTMAHAPSLVDLSHRILAYRAMDQGIITASPASFYRVMRAAGLTAHRGFNRGHTGHSKAPVREDLTGPLQRLCWDISYLRLSVKWTHLYLYVILDEFSRKALGWRVRDRLSQDIVLELMDTVFQAEGILDLPQELRPSIINDRGSQMKAKPVKLMFQDLGIDQRFSRPRTPNDNPYVESFFRTVKYHPDYPESFASEQEAITYFQAFFDWYNNHHLHSRIGFVTPADKHSGRAVEIQSRREEAKRKARQTRRATNCGTTLYLAPEDLPCLMPGQALQCVASD